jgi:hypothetical protein
MSSFDYLTNVGEIPTENAEISKKITKRMYPTTLIEGDDFKSGRSVVIEFTTSNFWASLNESPMSCEFALSDNAGALLTTGDGISLSSNPMSGLFDKGYISVNDEKIGSNEQYGQNCAFYYKTNVSDEFKRTIGSSYGLNSHAERIENATKSLRQEVSHIPTICVCTDETRQMIPPNSKIKYEFLISSSWRQRVIETIKGTPKVYGVDYLVSVKDIVLNLTQYQGGEALRNTDIYFNFKNIVSNFDNVSPNVLKQVFKFNVSGSMYRTSLYLQDANASNTTTDTPIGMFRGATDEEQSLKSYEMKLGQKTYKNEVDFDLRSASLKVLSEYNNTIQNIDAFGAPCGLQSFNEWLKSPYYSHRMPRTSDEYNDYMDVTLEFHATKPPSDLNIFMVQETSSILKISYDSNGMVSGTLPIERSMGF